MGFNLASNRYAKPNYHTAVRAGATGYKPFNGYIGGDSTTGPRTISAIGYTLTFTAAPTNASTLTILDPQPSGSQLSRLFTFTYSGSPGSGVIPLVAGGGTAAQAAAATQLALAAQLTGWTVTNPTATSVRLVQKQVGISPTVARSDTTNITLAVSSPTISTVLPGKVGKSYCILPA